LLSLVVEVVELLAVVVVQVDTAILLLVKLLVVGVLLNLFLR
jgi:hypothetical protein